MPVTDELDIKELVALLELGRLLAEHSEYLKYPNIDARFAAMLNKIQEPDKPHTDKEIQQW